MKTKIIKHKQERICDGCGYGIGSAVYACDTHLDGKVFCSMNCYVDASIDFLELGGLKGKFNLKMDGHGGRILEL